MRGKQRPSKHLNLWDVISSKEVSQGANETVIVKNNEINSSWIETICLKFLPLGLATWVASHRWVTKLPLHGYMKQVSFPSS